MAQMQALLKIKADVEGEGKINALGRAIGGLSSTAGKVSGGLRGLAGAAGGLSGALGSLVPLATGAGLAAMAKGAIDAADDMNDLSQKTGVSVESLSKFQQAANASGTSIEGVGAAMIKLNRNLATGNAGATEALTSLGVSATDASGKLKSTDAIMLEVADKFAKMPDGAGKTAAAMALFGKAGADMIPLLNGGSKAVTDLSATMTGAFAKGADSLNDKLAALQGKLLALGVNIGTALMPALNVIADLVMGLANGFAAMPGPIQAIVGGVVALAAAFVVLAPAISAVISIAGVLAGLKIGATIAGTFMATRRPAEFDDFLDDADEAMTDTRPAPNDTYPWRAIGFLGAGGVTMGLTYSALLWHLPLIAGRADLTTAGGTAALWAGAVIASLLVHRAHRNQIRAVAGWGALGVALYPIALTELLPLASPLIIGQTLELRVIAASLLLLPIGLGIGSHLPAALGTDCVGHVPCVGGHWVGSCEHPVPHAWRYHSHLDRDCHRDCGLPRNRSAVVRP